MRPADYIKDVFTQAKIPTDSEQTERILGDALKELQKRSPIQGTPKRPSRWRILMNSKTTQLSAAAVLLLALGLFLSSVNQPTAYGMDEVPALYKLAKTLHLKGTRYFAENNSDKSTVVEYWIDRENNRWRSRAPNYAVNNGEVTVYPIEQVYNGKGLSMMMDHGSQQATYFRLSQLDQTLMEYKYLSQLFNDAFGDPSFYDAYEVVDNEVIDDIEYEIWEAVAPLHSGPTTKVRSWLDTHTGHVLKTKTWWQGEDAQWRLISEMNTVQRDIAIPAHIFNLDPPTGYTVASTPENAQAMPMPCNSLGLRPGRLNVYLLFALPDGSLIACWNREPDEESAMQTPPWYNRRAGDDYPSKPLQVHALKTLLTEEELVFEGCHLAHTLKEGKDYAWGLYVSKQRVAESRMTRQRFLVDHQTRGGAQMWLGINAVVESEADFGSMVLQAMIEFSDEDDAPQLTLQQVLELTAQKRAEQKQ